MPGKTSTPEQIANVIALREAGFTLASIAERTKLSASTVSRIVVSHRTSKGSAVVEVVNAARKELRDALKSKDTIAYEAGRMICDDLAQARSLRERLSVAAENLKATNLEETALLMRAAAAYSTALKNTSDMVRHSLGYDRQRDELESEDLPVLTVRVVSDDEVKKLRSESVEPNHFVADDTVLVES